MTVSGKIISILTDSKLNWRHNLVLVQTCGLIRFQSGKHHFPNQPAHNIYHQQTRERREYLAILPA